MNFVAEIKNEIKDWKTERKKKEKERKENKEMHDTTQFFTIAYVEDGGLKEKKRKKKKRMR